MKRFLTIFLAIILIISMTACGKGPELEQTADPTGAVIDETVSVDGVGGVDIEATEAVVGTVDMNHIHVYNETTIVATCIEGGCTAYVCECGDSYNDNHVEAVGHAWGEWYEVAGSTETSEGKAERSCSTCYTFETKSLPKVVSGHTHKYKETVTREPTCANEGEKTLKCSCGHEYTESIKKSAHDYDKDVVDPTCTSKGYVIYSCKNCSYGYNGSYMSAKAHDYISKVTVESTCSKAGTILYTCRSCGNSYTGDAEKAKHTYSSKNIKPTCEDRGYTEYTCKCGDTYNDHYLNASGHKWGGWVVTKEATKKSDGSAERVCSMCNKNETKTLPKIVENHVHSYNDEVTREATCETEGVKTFACSCGDKYTESIEKTNHSYNSKVIAPTCANKGYTEYKCSGCEESYRDTYTDMIEHGYTSVVTKEPTCSQVGVRTYTCSSCGAQYTEDVAKVDHVYSETVTHPTCDNDGYTTYKCNGCGHTKIDNKTNAIGHTYDSVVTKPTCTDGGYTTKICTRCYYSCKTDETSAKGHAYNVTYNTATCTNGGTKMETCDVCGDKKTSASDATGHIETRTENVEPNCVRDGYTKVTCVSCGELISNTVVPASGSHSYETKNLSAAAKECVNQGDNTYLEYTKFKDWNVSACKHCGYVNLDTIKFAYSDYQAAAIMLGYINELRESVHGTSEYNLELDSSLIDMASVRAKELSVSYGHGGTYTGAGENITNSGKNIYDHFLAWKNSSEHYENMIEPNYKYFGYALYKPDGYGNTAVYGVQLFSQD